MCTQDKQAAGTDWVHFANRRPPIPPIQGVPLVPRTGCGIPLDLLDYVSMTGLADGLFVT
jgi:hypothetical protein